MEAEYRHAALRGRRRSILAMVADWMLYRTAHASPSMMQSVGRRNAFDQTTVQMRALHCGVKAAAL